MKSPLLCLVLYYVTMWWVLPACYFPWTSVIMNSPKHKSGWGWGLRSPRGAVRIFYKVSSHSQEKEEHSTERGPHLHKLMIVCCPDCSSYLCCSSFPVWSLQLKLVGVELQGQKSGIGRVWSHIRFQSSVGSLGCTSWVVRDCCVSLH